MSNYLCSSCHEDEMVCVPRAQYETLIEAIEDSNSLFAAMLIEDRPHEEIETQIGVNRFALNQLSEVKP